MSSKYEIAGISVERGNKKLGYLNIATMATGSEFRIAVHIIAGSKPGPTLCLLATEHGDETLGMDIISRVLTTIEPGNLSGQIVAIPLVNPLSFGAQTYNTPEDMKNIHLLFPGNLEGSLTEKMAYVIAHQVIDNVKCIINIHGGGAHTVLDFTYTPKYSGKVGKETVELAKVFGQEVLYLGEPVRGACTTYVAEERKVLGIIPEIGTDLMWPSAVKRFVEIGVRGVRNVLKHMGMIQGKLERPHRQIIIRNRRTIKSKQGGIFYPQHELEDLGKIVPKGTLLGRIVNPQSFEELERITTSYNEGILFLLRGRSRVHPGDYMFHVGDMKTAERIV